MPLQPTIRIPPPNTAAKSAYNIKRAVRDSDKDWNQDTPAARSNGGSNPKVDKDIKAVLIATPINSSADKDHTTAMQLANSSRSTNPDHEHCIPSTEDKDTVNAFT